MPKEIIKSERRHLYIQVDEQRRGEQLIAQWETARDRRSSFDTKLKFLLSRYDIQSSDLNRPLPTIVSSHPFPDERTLTTFVHDCTFILEQYGMHETLVPLYSAYHRRLEKQYGLFAPVRRRDMYKDIYDLAVRRQDSRAALVIADSPEFQEWYSYRRKSKQEDPQKYSTEALERYATDLIAVSKLVLSQPEIFGSYLALVREGLKMPYYRYFFQESGYSPQSMFLVRTDGYHGETQSEIATQVAIHMILLDAKSGIHPSTLLRDATSSRLNVHAPELYKQLREDASPRAELQRILFKLWRRVTRS